MIYFEDNEVGKTIKIKERYIVTEEEIIEMGLKWDPRPFHIDREAAADSVLGGLVACSAHIFAIFGFSGHLMEEPFAAVSALGFDKMKLHAPVMAGDEISYEYKVLSARLSKSRPDCGIVIIMTKLFNQRSELVFSVQSASLMSCRPNND